MSIDLSIKCGYLKLKNPVIAASGTFGYGKELKGIIDIDQLGGMITKTITLKPRQGNPPPRICETPSGMLNAIGLENPGLDYFCDNYLPVLSAFNTTRIVSIGGDKESDLSVMARHLSECKGIDALELNLSCPNLDKCKTIIATSPSLIRTAVKKVRKASRLPLVVKLSPNVTDIAEVAQAAKSAGADIISLINTLTGLAIDWRSRRPILGNITGGLSGPSIKPVALRMVWEVASKVKIPIIGMGGIMEGSDALEFLVAGASAVGVGTANIVYPDACLKIIHQMTQLLEEAHIKSVKEIINTMETHK